MSTTKEIFSPGVAELFMARCSTQLVDKHIIILVLATERTHHP